MIFTVEEPAFSCFDFRTLLKRGRGAINAACLKGPGLREDVQPSQLCHCERRRNRPPSSVIPSEEDDSPANGLHSRGTCFSYFDFRTLLKHGRAAINGRMRRAWAGKSVHEFRFAKIRDSMGAPLKPGFGLSGNVQSFQLCH